MNGLSFRPAGAFTLIELLIVVAIIAILALIAVPNFLEAQTRAKIARTQADMRSLKTAIESYRIDESDYPMSYNLPRAPRYSELSTPIAYITTCPMDPFYAQYTVNSVRYYHYVSATDELTWLIHNWRTYTYGWEDTSKPFPMAIQWHFRSNGPNRAIDHGLVYDATNGPVSTGDICIWGPGM